MDENITQLSNNSSRKRKCVLTRLKCNNCYFYAKTEEDLKLHQETHDEDSDVDNPAPVPKKFHRFQPRTRDKFATLITKVPLTETAVIDKSTNSSTEALQEANVDDHVTNVSNGLQCTECNFYGRSQEELLLHLWTHEDIDSDGPDSDRQGENETIAYVGDTVWKVVNDVAKYGTSKSPDCDSTDVDDPVMTVTTAKRLKPNTDAEMEHVRKVIEDVAKYGPPAKLEPKRGESVTPFKCLKCNKYFKTKRYLTEHIRLKKAVKKFKCSHCELSFHTRYTLKKHNLIHTNEYPIKCDSCDYSCRHTSQLTRHERAVHGLNLLTCDKCSYKTHQPCYLHNHQFKEHGVPKPNQCKICLKRFSIKNTLAVHMRSHSSHRPHECDICHSKFKLRDALLAHIKRHSSERPFKCDLCDAGYVSKSTLSSHKKLKHSNTPRKTFSCDTCSGVFKTWSSLKTHKMLHSGEKPFKCNQCKYATNNEFNLQKHKYVHSGAKPYKCKYCRFTCRNPSNLKVHVRSHTKKKRLSVNEIEHKPSVMANVSDSGGIRVRIKDELSDSGDEHDDNRDRSELRNGVPVRVFSSLEDMISVKSESVLEDSTLRILGTVIPKIEPDN